MSISECGIQRTLLGGVKLGPNPGNMSEQRSFSKHNHYKSTHNGEKNETQVGGG